MRIRHFLYNAFLIEAPGVKIAIDPGQNLGLFNLSSLIPKQEWADITQILITHGDPDHYWQADRVAEASNAPVICGDALARVEDGQTLLVDPRGKELTSWVRFREAYPLRLGETITSGDITIKAIKSVHGAITIPIMGFKIRKQPGPTERTGLGSTGFEITLGGKTIVNLGDSILLPDWRGLEPDLLMLPIGGLGDHSWTMDIAEAVEAVKLISPKRVIPCHFNVPLLWHRKFAPADGELFKQQVEALGSECHLMGYGEEILV